MDHHSQESRERGRGRGKKESRDGEKEWEDEEEGKYCEKGEMLVARVCSWSGTSQPGRD